MTGPRVIGLDLSLTSTGTAVVTAGGPVEVTTVKAPRPDPAGDPLARDLARLRHLRAVVGYAARGCDLAVLEGLAFGTRTGKASERAGLWWFVVDQLTDLGVPVAVMPPATRAMYATGKGNAPKDLVLVTTARLYPHVPVTGNDAADALVLAAAGLDHLGHPLRKLPQTHRRALDKVQWPTTPETP